MILYIYCAGGFGKEIMDIARRRNSVFRRWTEIKFIDDSLDSVEKYGAEVLNFEMVVQDGQLKDSEFVVANGEPMYRKKIVERVLKAGANLGKVVDTSALIVDSAHIGQGVMVAPFCSISSDAIVSKNSCINSMSIIGHDVFIGENSVISSMVNIGGACKIGKNCYIGMGTLIKESIVIGDNVIIGMGSVVYNDIPSDVIALGNPARPMRPNTDKKVFK